MSLWVSLCATSALAGTLSGQAYAVDGYTLIIKGQHIRLFGVDAFEHDQTCGLFVCGLRATEDLTVLMRGRVVRCDKKDAESYGRMVATCKLLDGCDLRCELVLAGLAAAYRT